MENLGKEAAQIAVKHAKAMTIELVEKVAEKALAEAVLKSETKMDDVVFAALAPTLKVALVELLSKIEA